VYSSRKVAPADCTKGPEELDEHSRANQTHA
jgi:hypothetical protein